MSLIDRLESARLASEGGAAANQPGTAVLSAAPKAPETPGRLESLATATQAVTSDALAGIKKRAADELMVRLGSRITDNSLDEEDVRRLVRDAVGAFIDDEQVPLTPEERRRLVREIVDEVLGLGPLQRLLDDPLVSEIMVNGPGRIYVERSGRLLSAIVPRGH